MLQFLAKSSDKYSVPELVQMAIEGGCKWVVVDLPEADDAELREMFSEVIPLCKESSTILTIVNHVELARELAIHGVLLRKYHKPVADVREMCGPEAIIGVEVDKPEASLPLPRLDVDYISLPVDMTYTDIRQFVEAVRADDVQLPIVACGNYPIDHLNEVMATGVSGLALSSAIADAHDPVAATETIINLINK